MRGLILVAMAVASGACLAGDPFVLDRDRIEQQVKQREQARQQWLEGSTSRVVGDAVMQATTHELGIDLRSWQYQGIESFLRDQGGRMRQVTLQTGWEVCARVCLSQDGYLGLRVQTLAAALSCHAGSGPSDCPPDMIPTSVVVHTHGPGSVVQATQVDNQMGHEGPVAWIEGEGNEPSPQDLESGPGWLLAPNGEMVRYGDHPEWMD